MRSGDEIPPLPDQVWQIRGLNLLHAGLHCAPALNERRVHECGQDDDDEAAAERTLVRQHGGDVGHEDGDGEREEDEDEGKGAKRAGPR